MYNLNSIAWSGGGNASLIQEQPLGMKGFTGDDVELLQEAHRSGAVHRDWGRAQFVANEFSQYLAIWDKASAERDPPTLSIIRFGKTGTYALLADDKIVASGDTLRAVLPALGIARPKAEPVMELAEG